MEANQTRRAMVTWCLCLIGVGLIAPCVSGKTHKPFAGSVTDKCGRLQISGKPDLFELHFDNETLMGICPLGSAFSPHGCDCVLLPPETASVPKECDKRPVPEKPGMFEQAAHGEYIRFACPAGTAFVQIDCGCTKYRKDPPLVIGSFFTTSQPDFFKGDLTSSSGFRATSEVRPPLQEFGDVSTTRPPSTNVSSTTPAPRVGFRDHQPAFKRPSCDKEPVDNEPEAFVQLVHGGQVKLACPLGTKFMPIDCGCTSYGLHDVGRSTPSSPTLAGNSNSAVTTKTPGEMTTPLNFCYNRRKSLNPFEFEVYDHGRWVAMPCAPGTAYSHFDCECSVSLSGNFACENWPVSGYPEMYYQLVHDEIYSRACPRGTLFSEEDCFCSIHDQPENRAELMKQSCKESLCFTYNSDFHEEHQRATQEPNDQVSLKNGRAVLLPGGTIHIQPVPDIGQNLDFAMSFNYQYQLMSIADEILLGNGNSSSPYTYQITYSGDRRELTTYLRLKDGSVLELLVPDVYPRETHAVKFAKSKELAFLQVDNQDPAVKKLSLDIAKSDSPLVIGNADVYQSVEYFDEVYTCIPANFFNIRVKEEI